MKRPKILLNGCFDIIHNGHVWLFDIASDLGIPYCAINSDESVRFIKGKDRPINSLFQRRENLWNYGYFKEIHEFNDEMELIKIIKKIKPDFILKGADTIYDKVYSAVTGLALVKAVIFIDHGNMKIHSSDLIK